MLESKNIGVNSFKSILKLVFSAKLCFTRSNLMLNLVELLNNHLNLAGNQVSKSKRCIIANWAEDSILTYPIKWFIGFQLILIEMKQKLKIFSYRI